jgi:hypothetical protein
LHLEGFAVLVVALLLYARQPAGWGTFFATILAPDLCLLGYLVNEKVGARCYNVVHTYAAPMLLLTALLIAGRLELSWIALVWVAHIGVDRLFGYGLKYADGPARTHIQRA